MGELEKEGWSQNNETSAYDAGPIEDILMKKLPCCYRIISPDGFRRLVVNARDGWGWRVLTSTNMPLATWALGFPFFEQYMLMTYAVLEKSKRAFGAPS